MARPTTIAVVLAGAVSKGAFEAGAIQALARTDVKIARIVAASSGSLTGTVLAAAVRSGDLVAGADRIAEIWRDHAAWNEIFHLSVTEIARRNGLSDQKRLLTLLRDHVAPSQPAQPQPVNLRMVTAPLGGRGGKIGHRPATSFEAICDFHSKDFATRDGLEAVFKAASASAAFPLVFAPVELPHWGRCIDGGCVNNTPIKWALDGEIGETIDTVVVIGTQVEHRSEPPEQLTGLTPLVSHLAEMLIDERLYRDLREAEQVNDAIGKLEALARAGHLDATQLAMVRGALGWSKRRQVPIVAIRPDKPLDGSAFGAFFDPVRRARYVEAGFHRALDVLAEHKFPHRPEPRRSVRDDHVVAVAAEPVELPGARERDRPE